ncbi:MAG: sulfate adenylyltransferase subunit CysN [Alphaproteobacteria bacterium]
MPESGQVSLERPQAAGGQTLLRFLTCGSVDDGKSTLIGRLLYESAALFDDQLAALERDSRRHGTTGEAIDFALALDGLEAEREQGITIDVAYRYFSTPRRKFIVADTPGHEQYTRNMATGASNCEAAVLLVDARKGLLAQTRRHSIICSLLGIRRVVLAVNKIDLVGFDRARYEEICEEYRAFAKGLDFAAIETVPLSARFGDNVTVPSERTPWFAGAPLLATLEALDGESDAAARPFRLPVQLVIRPDSEFRGFAGTIAGGVLRKGAAVKVSHSGQAASVARIVTPGGDAEEAKAGEAVTVVLSKEIDVARGDVLAEPTQLPDVANQFSANLIWMQSEPLLPGRSYLLRLGTKFTPATVTTIKHRINVNTLDPLPAKALEANEIGVVNIETAQAIAFDAYRDNRETGAFILVDRETRATAGAGMILHGLRRATNVPWQALSVDKRTRATLKRQAPCTLWFTGLSGAGKSTIANLVEARLSRDGFHTMMLDGDNLRHGLNRDLGFSDADRVENIRRVGEVAKILVEAGLIVLCCFISPFRADRRAVRERFDAGEFLEIFVDAPLATCIERDPKGLYRKAIDGKIPNFTGISSAYEPPESPDLALETQAAAPDELAERVVALLEARGHLRRA